MEYFFYIGESKERQKKIANYLQIKIPKEFDSEKISNLQSLKQYIKTVGEKLEKAKELEPNNFEINQKLYKVYKSIGFLALNKENYLLAEIAFKKCLVLNKSKSKKLLTFLRQKRTQKQKQQLTKLVVLHLLNS